MKHNKKQTKMSSGKMSGSSASAKMSSGQMSNSSASANMTTNKNETNCCYSKNSGK